MFTAQGWYGWNHLGEKLLVELRVIDLSFRPVDFGPVVFSRVVAGRGELLPLSYDKKENVLFYCRI